MHRYILIVYIHSKQLELPVALHKIIIHIYKNNLRTVDEIDSMITSDKRKDLLQKCKTG